MSDGDQVWSSSKPRTPELFYVFGIGQLHFKIPLPFNNVDNNKYIVISMLWYVWSIYRIYIVSHKKVWLAYFDP